MEGDKDMFAAAGHQATRDVALQVELTFPQSEAYVSELQKRLGH